MISNIIIAVLSFSICIFIWNEKKSDFLKEVSSYFVSALFPSLFVIAMFFIIFRDIDKETLDFDLFSIILLVFIIYSIAYKKIKNKLKKDNKY